jgi:hypothetical protein
MCLVSVSQMEFIKKKLDSSMGLVNQRKLNTKKNEQILESDFEFYRATTPDPSRNGYGV